MNAYYCTIQTAWKNDVCHKDIVTMIQSWITMFKDSINAKGDIQDILTRIKAGENPTKIVEDFIYGARYETLRAEFST